MDNTGDLVLNEKKGGISSFTLKIIAITLMLCDHASVVFIPGQYTILRIIGRIAFPIFAFMIAEGASKTRSIPKYMARLAIFGIISEIPFDLALLSGGEKVFDNSGANVYFTLLLGLFAIFCIKNLRGKLTALMPFGVLLSLACAWFFSTDYGATGVAAIIIFYFATTGKKATRVILSVLAVLVACFHINGLADIQTALQNGLSLISNIFVFNILEVPAFLSLIFILSYHGQRGRRMNKYFFYAFYPVHILLLYVLGLLLS